MGAKKRKSGVGKALFGVTAVATAAGVAALAANKKVRTKVTAEAKSAWKKAKKDPRVKQAGREAGGLIAKAARTVGEWFK